MIFLVCLSCCNNLFEKRNIMVHLSAMVHIAVYELDIIPDIDHT